MNTKGPGIITKCCICGREKTAQGWQYQFTAGDAKSVYSHGFCSVCYDAEIMKAKMRLTMPTFPAMAAMAAR
jgi:hypothetical protein